MEFLNEKRVLRNGKPIETDDALLEEQIRFVEQKMEALKERCVRLYAHHYYERKMDHYDKNMREAERLWSDIRCCRWSEHTQILNLFQAKADCMFGSVFVGKQDYDEALSYLAEGKDRIEKDTLQYLIPEYYVRAAIEMAKCYIEKHSPASVLDDCLKKAEEVLTAQKQEICANYEAFYYDKLSLELKFQRLYAVMDKYTFEQEGSAGKAWKILEDVIKQYEQLPVSASFHTDCYFSYTDWKRKQDVSLRTTKGEFFKNLYFAVGEGIRLVKKQSTANLPPIVAGLWENVKQEAFLDRKGCGAGEAGICQLPAADWDKTEKKDWSEEELRKLQRYFLELTFSVFAQTIKEYPANTICLDDLAALLYDYKDGDKTDQKKQFLLYLIEKYLSRDYQKETVEQSIEAILDRVLEIERTNMFALSIRAEMAMTDPVSERIDDYPALRQYSLKKWFSSMLKSGVPTGPFQEIEIALLQLYRYVTWFMNRAIIDWKKEKWEHLEVGHYTRMAVLPKLYNKNQDTRLRLHNVHHLNDPLEGVLLINRLREAVPVEADSLIQTLWDKYNSDEGGAVRNMVYMGSFTSRLDHLNMWDRYGDRQKGVALCFDGKEYFDKEAKISFAKMSTSGSYGRYKLEDIRYPLYMVLYLPEENRGGLEKAEEYASHRKAAAKAGNDKKEESWWGMQADLIRDLIRLEKKIRECLEKMQKVLREIEEDGRGTEAECRMCERLKDELCHAIMVILDLVRFLIKSDKYRDEREFRVIQYSDDPECEGEGTEVPRLYIPIEKELIYKRVCFGPLVKDFESKAAYVLNIKRNGADVEVQKSAISFKEG